MKIIKSEHIRKERKGKILEKKYIGKDKGIQKWLRRLWKKGMGRDVERKKQERLGNKYMGKDWRKDSIENDWERRGK